MSLHKKWTKNISKVKFAFQPIVNTETGKLFALEALIRDTDKLGFNNIYDFFDEAYYDGVLHLVDLELRKKALEKFKNINQDKIVLFYNIDNRILYDKNYKQGGTKEILKELDLKKKSICFEISERGELPSANQLVQVINNYKSEGFKIAVDDFGKGVSWMELLYNSDPNYLKIDKFYIRDIQNDKKKQLITQSIVKLANTLDISIIAEGIETYDELEWCKKLGISYIQGYYIDTPQLDVLKLKKQYTL